MHTYKHEVKYHECDKMGITHHSNYVKFMEEARVDWLDQIGYGFERVEAEGVFSPVLAIACNYKNPTTFKDIIEIEVSVSKMSEIKFDFAFCKSFPVALSKRLPELYKAIQEAYEAK